MNVILAPVPGSAPYIAWCLPRATPSRLPLQDEDGWRRRHQHAGPAEAGRASQRPPALPYRPHPTHRQLHFRPQHPRSHALNAPDLRAQGVRSGGGEREASRASGVDASVPGGGALQPHLPPAARACRSKEPQQPISCNGSPWLVEGKLRYVELSLKGSKHVTQLHVARDLPADLVLGVDFLKKAQIRVSFPDSAITLPSGTQEVKVSFLTSREMTQHQRRSSNTGGTSSNKTRAYSSNY